MNKSFTTTLPLISNNAVSGSSMNEFVNVIGEFMPGSWAAESKNKDAGFSWSFSSVEMGSTPILSTYQTPATYVGAFSDSFIISIPFFGYFKYEVDRKQIIEEPKKTASLMAGGMSSGGSTIGEDPNVAIAYTLDSVRLRETLNSMLGDFDSKSNVLNLDESRELPMNFGKENLFVAIDQLIKQMNALKDHPKILRILGIEDQLYRFSAALLAPELVLLNQEKIKKFFKRPITAACEYIKEHLTEHLTLTDLERVSGLSSRALQYSFAKEFGCTPIEWIRHERLCLAKEKLLSGHFTKVTDVAFECGFGNLGHFSRHYRVSFGELPSETLIKSS